MAITSKFFGRTQSGEDVYEFTLENENGMQVRVLEYGCTVTHILVKDKNGAPQDVVLGFNTLEAYEQCTSCLGMFIGRYANRLENAQFTLDGKTYRLTPNDGPNHLHGTWARKVFKGSVEDDKLVLRLHSPSGDDGFPGAVDVTVTYWITEENAFVLDYVASTDAPTIINLTNHSYFNLNGQGSRSMLDNTLQLFASHFTEGNAQTLPTGRILPVEGTPFDFKTQKPIGQDIHAADVQLTQANGYDHNFVLDKEPGRIGKIAVAHSDATGITMSAYTTQPGVQLYTGNFLQNDVFAGKAGLPYVQNQGFCLETQHYPCTPSHPEFPSVTLRPDEEYHETTAFCFSCGE